MLCLTFFFFLSLSLLLPTTAELQFCPRFRVYPVAHQTRPGNTLILENNHPAYIRLLGIKLGGTENTSSNGQEYISSTQQSEQPNFGVPTCYSAGSLTPTPWALEGAQHPELLFQVAHVPFSEHCSCS